MMVRLVLDQFYDYHRYTTWLARIRVFGGDKWGTEFTPSNPNASQQGSFTRGGVFAEMDDEDNDSNIGALVLRTIMAPYHHYLENGYDGPGYGGPFGDRGWCGIFAFNNLVNRGSDDGAPCWTPTT